MHLRKVYTLYTHSALQTRIVRLSSVSSIASDDVRFEKVGGVGVITLNKPRALNALTHSMVVAMDSKIQVREST